MTGEELITRARLAELAGVRRPAVTNWERRHPDYPTPHRTDDGLDLFRASEVAAWLDGRAIPANARRPGEPPGTTYGARFRAAQAAPGPGRPETGDERAAVVAAVRHLMGWARLELLTHTPTERTDLLLTLIHLRISQPSRWTLLRGGDLPRRVPPLGSLPDEVAQGSQQSLAPLSVPAPSWRLDARTLERVILAVDRLPVTPETGRIAADHLLREHQSELGSRSGWDFFTPPSLVNALVGLLAPDAPRERAPVIRDPSCGMAEFLVAAHASLTERAPRLSGCATTEPGLRLACLNTALHGAGAELRLAPPMPSLGMPGFPGPADLILCNPPFSLRPSAPPADHQPYWRFGVPPARRAAFDWLQYVLGSLAPGGRAAVVMTPNAAFTRLPAEQAIRAAMVEAGAVECVIALPSMLFPGLGIAVTIWLLRGPAATPPPGQREVLFINGRHLGSMSQRTQRELTGEDIAALTTAYRSWRDGRRTGIEGLSRAVNVTGLRRHGHDLSPERHVLPPEERRSSAGELARLCGTLSRLHREAEEADRAVARLLREYGPWTS